MHMCHASDRFIILVLLQIMVQYYSGSIHALTVNGSSGRRLLFQCSDRLVRAVYVHLYTGQVPARRLALL